jgi:AraC-like DNA-binding protein
MQSVQERYRSFVSMARVCIGNVFAAFRRARSQHFHHCLQKSNRRHWRKIATVMDPMNSSLTDAAISVRAYRGEYGTYCHAHAQVLVGFRGSLQLEVEGRPAFVDPSCGLVIPAGAGHGYMAQTPAEVMVLDCDAARATDRLRRFALPSRWPSASTAWTAEQLLVELLDAPILQIRRRLDLAALAQHVDAELHRDWTVAALASLCRFSPQHFRARFSELTGLSPLAWVRQRRLDEAQRQVRAGLPLDTVALQIGYASASALCFALRRERGIGARQLRARADPVRASLDI